LFAEKEVDGIELGEVFPYADLKLKKKRKD